MKHSFTAMKHTAASFLAFALAASASIAVFATSTNDGSNSTSIQVNGSYQADSTANVVSVDIKWDNMDFIYSAGNKGTWDPKTHTYTSSTEGWRWNNQTGDSTKTLPEITVVNHSNTSVNVSFSFVNTANIDGLVGSFLKYDESSALTDLPDNKLTLATAENTNLENAPQETTYFSVGGTGITPDIHELGSITIAVTTGEVSQ